jgi:hypothetical protein
LPFFLATRVILSNAFFFFHQVLRHDLSTAQPIKRKEHLKYVPDYLVPASMRTTGAGQPGSGAAKKKKRKVSGPADKRIQASKMRDPLLNPGAVEGDDEGDADGDDGDDQGAAAAANDNSNKIFTESELARQSSQSTSGRRAWQMRHKKGKFNPKAAKKNSHRVAGTFTKSKKFK